MAKLIDLTGQRFGKLTVIERAENGKNGEAKWLCKCDCGNTSIVFSLNLTRLHTTSCGCAHNNVRLDLTGKRFGKLTAVKITSIRKHRVPVWECLCDCGNTVYVTANHLSMGNQKSCGCINKEIERTGNLIHGKCKSRLYGVWTNMRQRCNNPSNTHYKYYGERGIKVCTEWEEDFINFYNWAMSNGYDENAPYGECTIDRIDNNKGYSPDNCRFVNLTVQANNKSNNRQKKDTTPAD